MMRSGLEMRLLPAINSRESIRMDILHQLDIGWIKPCSKCHRNRALEKFGACKECWDNACRKIKICAFCYESTRFFVDSEKNVERLLKIWDNWKWTYCSEKCRGKAKSRRWRKENPEKKQMSNLKYLKDIEKDVKKTLKEKSKKEVDMD